MKIGSLELPGRVLQSPMAGCTDLAFRLIAREKGMAFALTEMVAANSLRFAHPGALTLLETCEADAPVGAQLVGCDPGPIAEGAARLEEMGFDLVDLNLGCPVRKIVKGGAGAGSALLARPDDAERVFRAAAGAVRRVPVTVKMRIGFKDLTGAEAVEIARRAEAAGLAAVTVHGRAQAQNYSHPVDFEAIRRVKEAVSIPVIGNGSIYGGADAVEMVEKTGCDGVMIGRGCFGNPWIYRECEAALGGEPAPARPSVRERMDVLLEHFRLEVEHLGERKALFHMRRIACWYVEGLPGKAAFRDAVNRAPDFAALDRVIRTFAESAVRAGEAGAVPA